MSLAVFQFEMPMIRRFEQAEVGIFKCDAITARNVLKRYTGLPQKGLGCDRIETWTVVSLNF